MAEFPIIDRLIMRDKRLTSVSFSHDEKIAVGCATDSSGYVYNIDESTSKLTDKENPTVLENDKEGTSLCRAVFHPNKKILGIFNFGKITLWSYEDDEFKLLHTIKTIKGNDISSFAFDPSETNYFAYAEYGMYSGSYKDYIVVLNLTSIYNGNQQNLILRPKHILYNRKINNTVFNMSFHPSKKILAIGMSNCVILFRIGTVEPIRIFENYREPNSRLTSLTFHNNGNWLASGYNTGKVILYKSLSDDLSNIDIHMDTVMADKGVYLEINSLAFHPTQLILAAGCNNRIFFWKFEQGVGKFEIKDNEINNYAISFHPNLSILASISDIANSLLLYNVSSIEKSTNHNGGRVLQMESRFFKLVSVNGKKVDGGRYELPSKTKSGKAQTRGPKDKASIALSEICKKNNKKGECSYKFSIQETTRGSNKKIYNYEGKRVKLAKPIILELKDKKTGMIKKVVKKYKNIIITINSNEHH